MITKKAQTIPSIHHEIFPATFNTLVFLINQWQATKQIVINDTLITASHDNNAAPFVTLPNIELSKRQAVLKSVARKNTHVTFTRKKVSNANMKLEEVIFLKKRGAI